MYNIATEQNLVAMAETKTPVCEFGLKAPDFNLPDTDGNHHRLTDSMSDNGLLVMFICNHCPYVKAILDRIVRDATELESHGIGSVAIMSNDPNEYTEDSPTNMKKVAKKHKFPFPYLYDETQKIAKAYGAVCTPDFFGYNNKFELQYRGRLDSSGMQHTKGTRRELYHAMVAVAETGRGPEKQTPSIGCSIKWRHGQ